jgi:hypothetical protein
MITICTRLTANRLHERYAAWRRESTAVQLAYERWAGSERDTCELAYAGYLAALDQEAHTAAGYRDELARLTRILGRTPP